MAQPYYLIDSNAVIDYLSNRLPLPGMAFMNHVVDSIAHVSVITKIVVLDFDSPKEDVQILSGFMDDSVVLFITEEIAQRCIDLRKAYSINLPDANHCSHRNGL